MRVVRDSAMSGEKSGSTLPNQRHMNLRLQGEHVGFPGILDADRPPGGLRRAEVNPRIGGSIATVLVEDQVFGFEVDGILELLGSALVRSSRARWIGFQIDLHFPVTRDVARFLVVGEVIPINLVEAGGIAAVENDADVVQFGAPVQLELLELAGLDGEQGALAVRLGELKTIRGLLDVNPNLVGNFSQHVAQAHAGIEIRPRHHRDKQYRDHSQPAS